MTITSDSSGYIDYAAFGVGAADLSSLKALASIWRQAVVQCSDEFVELEGGGEFVALTALLPERIADAAWQSQWIHAWYKLGACGLTLAELFAFLNSAIVYCEHELFGDSFQVGRLQLELFAILRRCVVAAVSCAIELDDVARTGVDGGRGEFAALRWLRELASEGRAVAVLSVSMDGRRSFAHLSATEIPSVPGLLTGKLTSLLRTEDRVLGGREGEWLLLLPDVSTMAQPALAATRIRQAFAEPLILASGRGLTFSAVVGVAMMPAHGQDADEIIQAARLARTSLQNSDESFAMFDVAMRQAWLDRQQLSSELHQAMRQERMTLYLQAQVDMLSQQCIGAELLLRWQRENGDWVPPPLIMEIVAENGWRTDFSNWLIRSALRHSSELEQAGVLIPLSINLTADDFLDSDLPELFAQCLATWDLPGSRLIVELTESVMMLNRERALAVMNGLRQLGIRLALDDFGTGFSSLNYLATMPLNEIKIDRSFVVAMNQSAEGLRIVRAIIELVRDLGMSPLAEGIDDPAQREELLRLGCNRVQGNLYAEAMAQSAFIRWYFDRQS